MSTNTSDEECAVVCMIVSNPQGGMRTDGDGWQKRVNDLIRALRDERNELRNEVKQIAGMLEAALKPPPKDLTRRG